MQLFTMISGFYFCFDLVIPFFAHNPSIDLSSVQRPVDHCITMFISHSWSLQGGDVTPRTKEKAYVNTHATYEKKKQSSNTNSSGSSEKKGCPMCKSHEHIAEKCAEFTKLSVNERWKFVKEMKLCRRCLVAHTRWPCEGEVCGVHGCQKRHHRLLHYVPEPEKPLATTNATFTVH